jgi:hypothetical protein
LWAFLSQVLHKGEQRSCLAAVSRVIVLLVALGRGACANMVSGMAMGPYKGKETGEMALLRQLLDQLDGDDILLADRYYCSYFMIALLLKRNASLVARLHQLRKTDYQRARRLGKNDYLVTWTRPIKPSWMDEETYNQIPESLTLRLIDMKISEPGFRVESMKVVTTKRRGSDVKGTAPNPLLDRRDRAARFDQPDQPTRGLRAQLRHRAPDA